MLSSRITTPSYQSVSRLLKLKPHNSINSTGTNTQQHHGLLLLRAFSRYTGKRRANSTSSSSNSSTTTTSKLSLEEEAKAGKMFKELSELMLKRQQRQHLSQSKSWPDAIGAFWNTSKHQLINIAAAFGCVLMAIQVTDARITARKNATILGEANAKVNELNKLLSHLSSEEFAKGTATKCSTAILSSLHTNTNAGSFFFFTRKSTEVQQAVKNSNNSSTSLLADVIRKEIKGVLGDKNAYSDKERAEMEMKQLQSFIGIGNELNADARELMALVGETEEITKEDGATVIKKRRIMF